jgi:antitoxin component YwqK of YwqJK toxin-antitoxin module
MKTSLTTLVTILFVSLLSSPSLSEGISFDDLVERNGLTYKKFTDVPFTGEVGEGLVHGNFKNGKLEGPFVSYYENGQLKEKVEAKNGEPEGPWVEYYENGQLEGSSVSF